MAAALVGMADAEDAAQEVYTRAWESWPALRDHSALRSWLLRITYNVCSDWRRGRFGTRRARSQPLMNDDDTHARVATLEDDPGASGNTARLDLRAAINHLAAEHREVIALRYYAGMDATEIGAALGLPAPTVRSRLRRALTLLRERLVTPGEHPAIHAPHASIQAEKGGR